MKLLIVEDEPQAARYLRLGLSERGFTASVADNGVDGLHLALETDFDAIVLDVMLPGIDGFAVLSALRARKSTPVLMLTARSRVEDRVRALEMGADDYLAKPYAFSELLARLQALLRRGQKIEGTTMVIADLEVDLLKRRASRAGKRLDLSAREFALLALLLRRRGHVVSQAEILEYVWDIHFEAESNVVEVAVRRLRMKLDRPFSRPLLHNVRGIGYILEDRSVEMP
jgi:heavy metal response regulator